MEIWGNQSALDEEEQRCFPLPRGGCPPPGNSSGTSGDSLGCHNRATFLLKSNGQGSATLPSMEHTQDGCSEQTGLAQSELEIEVAQFT